MANEDAYVPAVNLILMHQARRMAACEPQFLAFELLCGALDRRCSLPLTKDHHWCCLLAIKPRCPGIYLAALLLPSIWPFISILSHFHPYSVMTALAFLSNMRCGRLDRWKALHRTLNAHTCTQRSRFCFRFACFHSPWDGHRSAMFEQKNMLASAGVACVACIQQAKQIWRRLGDFDEIDLDGNQQLDRDEIATALEKRCGNVAPSSLQILRAR
eukprot:3443532-Pleurochrysis_carterae.AAC.2